MKRYIVDGNVTDTRHVVGFASERLFVDYTDHAALLCAVADEVKGMEHGDDCPVAAQEWRHMHEDGPMPRWDECNCPRGKVLAMLEVE